MPVPRPTSETFAQIPMNRVALIEDHPQLSALLAKDLLNAGIESDAFRQIEPTLRSLTPEWADIQFRPAEGCMTCGTEMVTLAPAELQIMVALIHAGGGTVRRSGLEVAAWGLGAAVTPNALDVAMHRLKRKLVAINSTLQIVNARGYGYALRVLPSAP
jgi:hypothetical protein